MEWVYAIKVWGITRYIGHTNDLARRSAEHNNLCFNKMTHKRLYKEIRKYNDLKKIQLIPICQYKTKLEAKRYECFLILDDYFRHKLLWQKVPRISDL